MDMRKELCDAINELCLSCGKYELEHEGACNNCRWNQTKEHIFEQVFNEAMEEMRKPQTHDGVMRDIVSDLMDLCGGECYTEEEDDNGDYIITWRCPFLDKSSDVFKAECLIYEPYDWSV